MTQRKGLHIYANDSILCNRLYNTNMVRNEAWIQWKIYTAADSAGFPNMFGITSSCFADALGTRRSVLWLPVGNRSQNCRTIREEWGFNQPIYIQYFTWLKKPLSVTLACRLSTGWTSLISSPPVCRIRLNWIWLPQWLACVLPFRWEFCRPCANTRFSTMYPPFLPCSVRVCHRFGSHWWWFLYSQQN